MKVFHAFFLRPRAERRAALRAPKALRCVTEILARTRGGLATNNCSCCWSSGAAASALLVLVLFLRGTLHCCGSTIAVVNSPASIHFPTGFLDDHPIAERLTSQHWALDWCSTNNGAGDDFPASAEKESPAALNLCLPEETIHVTVNLSQISMVRRNSPPRESMST
jgi:hypothetical protein